MFVTVSGAPFDSRSHLAKESHGFERALISINGPILNYDEILFTFTFGTVND